MNSFNYSTGVLIDHFSQSYSHSQRANTQLPDNIPPKPKEERLDILSNPDYLNFIENIPFPEIKLESLENRKREHNKGIVESKAMEIMRIGSHLLGTDLGDYSPHDKGKITKGGDSEGGAGFITDHDLYEYYIILEELNRQGVIDTLLELLNMRSYSPNGKHKIWIERVKKENQNYFKSMNYAVDMGMVKEVPMSTNSPYYQKRQTSSNLRETLFRQVDPQPDSPHKFPLKNIYGPLEGSTKFYSTKLLKGDSHFHENNWAHAHHPSKLDTILERKKMIRHLTNIANQGKKTYEGQNKLNYMQATIDLRQPDYERVEIMRTSSANTSTATSKCSSQLQSPRGRKDLRIEAYDEMGGYSLNSPNYLKSQNKNKSFVEMNNNNNMLEKNTFHRTGRYLLSAGVLPRIYHSNTANCAQYLPNLSYSPKKCMKIRESPTSYQTANLMESTYRSYGNYNTPSQIAKAVPGDTMKQVMESPSAHGKHRGHAMGYRHNSHHKAHNKICLITHNLHNPIIQQPPRLTYIDQSF